jgi:hypothetical protein
VNEQDRFFVFFGVWAVLGLASGLFMWRGSPGAKRTWFPRLTVLTGVLFVAFAYWAMPYPHILYFLVPASALITVLNLKLNKFCAQCGAYHQSFPPFYKVSFCRKCGKELA